MSGDLYLDYARRGRNAWWRYVLGVVLAVVLVFAIGIGLGVVLNLAHLMPADLAQQLTHPSNPAVFFTGTGATFALFVVALGLAVLIAHGKRPWDLLGRWNWRLVGAGFALWMLAATLAAGVDAVAAPGSIRVTAGPATATLALFAAIGLGAQTFAEEYVFRGYITQALMLLLKRPWLVALISAAIFGSAHIPNGWPQAAGATLFGFATALIAIRLGGVAFTWGLHLANNLFGAVVIVSDQDVFKGSPGLLTQNAPQLMWWDVGVEAVLLAIVVALVWRRTATAAAEVF